MLSFCWSKNRTVSPHVLRLMSVAGVRGLTSPLPSLGGTVWGRRGPCSHRCAPLGGRARLAGFRALVRTRLCLREGGAECADSAGSPGASSLLPKPQVPPCLPLQPPHHAALSLKSCLLRKPWLCEHHEAALLRGDCSVGSPWFSSRLEAGCVCVCVPQVSPFLHTLVMTCGCCVSPCVWLSVID